MILLFTTTDMMGPRQDQLQRLLDSLAVCPDLPIRHYLLLQNCTENMLAEFRRTAPKCCRVSRSPKQVSISLARNLLLDKALADGFADDCIAGFPDDDCWFPARFLHRLHAAFQNETGLDLLVCGVSLTPRSVPFEANEFWAIQVRELVRQSSSNNIFLRGWLIRELGPFDLDLGLGAPAGGGEDTDYAIRAFLRAEDSRIIKQPLVGHKEPDLQSAAKYFNSSLLVLARYAGKNRELRAEFFRKIFVGVYFIGKRRLSLATYSKAMLQAFRQHSTPRPAARWGQ